MSDVLTHLFKQVKIENIGELETPQLADFLLIALKDCDAIYESRIISKEALLSALGYDNRRYPSPSPVIDDSEGDGVLMELMAAWQWLKREVYLIVRPDHMFSGSIIGPGEKPLEITRRGYEHIVKLVKNTDIN